MATYNGSRYLTAQIDSILLQLAEGDEFLVSDDASTDETPLILNRYGSRLRVIGTDRAGGVVPNFSRVLAHASGDLIVLADQDDVWLPGRLSAMRDCLIEFDLVLCNAAMVDEQLRPLEKSLFDETGARLGFWRNVVRNSFVGCCMGFRRSLLSRALPFPRSTPWHDWLLGLLALQTGQVCLMTTPSLLYRRHANNASPTGERSRNSLPRKLLLRAKILLAVAACLARGRNGRQSAHRK